MSSILILDNEPHDCENCPIIQIKDMCECTCPLKTVEEFIKENKDQ